MIFVGAHTINGARPAGLSQAQRRQWIRRDGAPGCKIVGCTQRQYGQLRSLIGRQIQYGIDNLIYRADKIRCYCSG